MSTQTEFDKTINNILLSVNVIPDGETFDVNDYTKAIKQAVDKYVIGETIPPEQFERIKITVPKGVNMIEVPYSAQVTRNHLKAEQRLALWGDK